VTISFNWCCFNHNNSLSTFMQRLNCLKSLWNGRFSTVSSLLFTLRFLLFAFRTAFAIYVKQWYSFVTAQCSVLGKQAIKDREEYILICHSDNHVMCFGRWLFDHSKSFSSFLSSDMAFKAEYPLNRKAAKSISQPGSGFVSDPWMHYPNMFWFLSRVWENPDPNLFFSFLSCDFHLFSCDFFSLLSFEYRGSSCITSRFCGTYSHRHRMPLRPLVASSNYVEHRVLISCPSTPSLKRKRMITLCLNSKRGGKMRKVHDNHRRMALFSSSTANYDLGYQRTK
jgi:hypothetical protein